MEILKKSSTFAGGNKKRLVIMALSIKSIPVLYGDAAARFDKEATANGTRQTPRLTSESRRRLHQFLSQSKDFAF